LYNIIAQKESKLNLEMAGQQRRLAHSAKRDNEGMKTLSALGAIFLPATYIASLFGMQFFNFTSGRFPYFSQVEASYACCLLICDLSSPDLADGVVSPLLWVYFVITVPITALVFLVWRIWDKRRTKMNLQDDDNLEAGIDRMEAQIMAMMRKRTLSKVRTWELGPQSGANLPKE
jgi:hypothetical protein